MRPAYSVPTRLFAVSLFLFVPFYAIGAIAQEKKESTPETPSEALNVLSFNIRQDNPRDGKNAWPHRKQWVADLIRNGKTDLAGLQEVKGSQRRDLAKLLPEYEMYGITRESDDADGESTSILFLRKRFRLLDKGTFWLSETPEKADPRGWDAACRRTVTWVKLKDNVTQKTFVLVNTHFDHRGSKARIESARLLRKEIPRLAGDAPVILTGDFNTLPKSEPYTILTAKSEKKSDIQFSDTRAITATPAKGPDSSACGFVAVRPGMRIDFIFTSPGIKVESYTSDDRTKDGRFPSDHLPVFSTVRLP